MGPAPFDTFHCFALLRDPRSRRDVITSRLGRRHFDAALVPRLYGLRRADPDDARANTGHVLFPVLGTGRYRRNNHGSSIPRTKGEFAAEHSLAFLGQRPGQRKLEPGAGVVVPLP